MFANIFIACPKCGDIIDLGTKLKDHKCKTNIKEKKMKNFSFRKMFYRGLKTGAAAGIITGGAVTALPLPPEVDTTDKALMAALITVGSFLWKCFINWKKNK